MFQFLIGRLKPIDTVAAVYREEEVSIPHRKAKTEDNIVGEAKNDGRFNSS